MNPEHIKLQQQMEVTRYTLFNAIRSGTPGTLGSANDRERLYGKAVERLARYEGTPLLKAKYRARN